MTDILIASHGHFASGLKLIRYFDWDGQTSKCD